MVNSTLTVFPQTVISPRDWRSSRCDSVLSLQQFLENTAYPLLEGSASFLLSWLIEGQRGYLETNPSTSPEHYFIAPNGKQACVSYSTTMDMSVIREVFSAVLLSADVSLFILFLKKTVFMSMQMLYDMDDVCSFAKV
jgi:hypothetical protein